MSIITVLTTKDDYTSPVRTESGQVVVNKDLLNKPANTYVYYDTDTDKYYNITEKNTSPDYYKKIMDLQGKLQAQNIFLDSADDKQINSFADITAQNVSKFGDMLHAYASGEAGIKEFFGKYNPLITTGQLIVDTAKYLKEAQIDPLLTKNKNLDLKDRGLALLSNTLTNLSETTNYFTGSAVIKGVVLGQRRGYENPLEAIKAQYVWDPEQGRDQLDYDLNTGHAIVDTIGNIFLEIISDPTNLIAFGAKAGIKAGIESTVSDTILASAKKSGIELNEDALPKVVSKIAKNVGKGEDLASVLRTVDYSSLIKGFSTEPDAYLNFLKNAQDTVNPFTEKLSYHILSNMRDAAHAVNEVATKAVWRTSMLSLGGDALKLGFRYGAKGMTYILSKLNAIDNTIKKPTIAKLPEVEAAIHTEYTKMADVYNVDKKVADRAVANASAQMQLTSIMRLRSIIYGEREWKPLLKKANQWAVEEGFKDIQDAYAKLLTMQSRVNSDLKPILNELKRIMDTKEAEQLNAIVKPLAELFTRAKKIAGGTVEIFGEKIETPPVFQKTFIETLPPQATKYLVNLCDDDTLFNILTSRDYVGEKITIDAFVEFREALEDVYTLQATNYLVNYAKCLADNLDPDVIIHRIPKTNIYNVTEELENLNIFFNKSEVMMDASGKEIHLPMSKYLKGLMADPRLKSVIEHTGTNLPDIDTLGRFLNELEQLKNNPKAWYAMHPDPDALLDLVDRLIVITDNCRNAENALRALRDVIQERAEQEVESDAFKKISDAFKKIADGTIEEVNDLNIIPVIPEDTVSKTIIKSNESAITDAVKKIDEGADMSELMVHTEPGLKNTEEITQDAIDEIDPSANLTRIIQGITAKVNELRGNTDASYEGAVSFSDYLASAETGYKNALKKPAKLLRAFELSYRDVTKYIEKNQQYFESDALANLSTLSMLLRTSVDIAMQTLESGTVAAEDVIAVFTKDADTMLKLSKQITKIRIPNKVSYEDEEAAKKFENALTALTQDTKTIADALNDIKEKQHTLSALYAKAPKEDSGAIDDAAMEYEQVLNENASFYDAELNGEYGNAYRDPQDIIDKDIREGREKSTLFTKLEDILSVWEIKGTIDRKDLYYVYNVLQHEDIPELDLLMYYLSCMDEAYLNNTVLSEKQLKSDVFALQTSKAGALNTILSDTGIITSLEHLLNIQGAGIVVDLIANLSEDGLDFYAKKLKSVAQSTYIMTNLMAFLIKYPEVFSAETRAAIFDTLGGMAQMHIKEFDPESVTRYVLKTSQEYLAKSTNSFIDYRYSMLSDSVEPVADLLHIKDAMLEGRTYQRAVKNKPTHQYYYGSSDTREEVIEWTAREELKENIETQNLNSVIADIADDYDGTTYDIYYSIGQFNTTPASAIYEMCLMLPDGSILRLIDDSLDLYRQERHLSDEYISDTYRKTKEKYKLAKEKDDALIKSRKSEINEMHFETTEDMYAYLNDFFSGVLERIDDDSNYYQSIRFIGFGNSMTYKNSDTILQKNLQRNSVYVPKQYFAETVDLEQMLSIKFGGNPEFPKVVADKLVLEFTRLKNILDSFNQRADSCDDYEVYLSPDFNHELMQSFDLVINGIDEALTNMKNASSDAPSNFSMLDQTTYSALVSLGETDLTAYLQELLLLRSTIGDRLNSIAKNNQLLSTDLVIWDNMKNVVHQPNPMMFLRGYLVTPEGVPVLAFKKFHDAKAYYEWFPDLEKSLTLVLVQRRNDVIRLLNRRIAKITHPEVFDGNIRPFLEHAVRELRIYITSKVHSKSVANFTTCVRAMKGRLSEQQLFAIANRYCDYLNSAPHEPTVKFIELLEQEIGTGLFDMIRHPEYGISSKQTFYAADIAPFKTKYLDTAVNPLLELSEESVAAERAGYLAESFEASLQMEESVKNLYGINVIELSAKREFLALYKALFVNLNNAIAHARNVYLELKTTSENAAKAFNARQIYTGLVSTLKNNIKNCADYFAKQRAEAITAMQDDYVYYLYKYCQGIQIFDLDSAVLKTPKLAENMQALIERFVSQKSPVRVITQGQYVYFILKKSKAEEIAKELETAKSKIDIKHKIPIPTVNVRGIEIPDETEFQTQFRKLTDYIDETYGGAYGLSTQRVMNEKRYKELLAHLPEEIRKWVLPIEFLYDNKLLSGFNHTVVGDYGAGAGIFYDTLSPNLITNMMSGCSGVFSRLSGKSLYLSMFNNPSLSLRLRFHLLQRNGYQITVKELNESLAKTGYRLARIENDQLIFPVIRTERDLKHALKTNTILIDYATADHLDRALTDNSIHNSIYQRLVQQPLLVLKLGMLQSPGWVLRNILDSFTKGSLASGSVIDYLCQIRTTVEYYNKYMTVLRDIVKTYGKTDIITIKKYFNTKNLVPAVKDMTFDLFVKINEFFNSSSSAATTAQLNMLNDTAGKLYTKFGKDLGLEKTDINLLLNAYVENKGGYTLVLQSLKKTYPEGSDVPEKLMGLYAQIPENYVNFLDSSKFNKILNWVTDHNPIMRFNTDVETIARLHTYLFNVTENSTTIGKAMQLVDRSQFNRAHDSAGQKVFETMLPFSSFAIDNVIYWQDMLENASGPILSLMNGYLQGRYDEEEDFTPEMLFNNYSVRYMFLSGNWYLNKNNGLTLKVSDSFSSMLQLTSDPVSYLTENLMMPIQEIISFGKAVATGEITTWDKKNYASMASELLPLFGALWLRYQSAWTKPASGNAVWSFVFPSIFGVTLNYNVKPVGYNWYDQDEEYKKTHSFVVGISYVPAFIQSNPQTYADTFTRLKNMGYTEEEAREMIVDYGYYMKAPDYILKRFIPGVGSMKVFGGNKPPKMRTFKKAPTYVKKTHGRRIRSYPVKDYDTSLLSRVKMYHRQPRRIFRESIYSKRFGANGVPRHLMLQYRGNATCITRAIRKQVISRRQRTQRMSWWLGL